MNHDNLKDITSFVLKIHHSNSSQIKFWMGGLIIILFIVPYKILELLHMFLLIIKILKEKISEEVNNAVVPMRAIC
mgnify:CR=1 FL=1